MRRCMTVGGLKLPQLSSTTGCRPSLPPARLCSLSTGKGEGPGALAAAAEEGEPLLAMLALAITADSPAKAPSG